MKMRMQKKVLAGILVGAMMLSTSACGSADIKADAVTVMEPQQEETEELGDLSELVKTTFNPDKALESDKDETVYVIADASGDKKKVIVSEWLKNPDGSAELKDKSTLSDIENVRGDEGFTQDGDSLTWQADGNSVYYQGKTDAEVPVGVKIKYYLDGQEMSPDEIAGKSGSVKIVFEYINNAKTGDVYAPFIMGSGLLLDGDSFTDVQVTHGKVISDGNRFIIVGFGLPGLEESLDLELDGFEIPSSIEVTANTTAFSLDMALTLALENFINGN